MEFKFLLTVLLFVLQKTLMRRDIIRIHPFDYHVIWPASLALINRQPMTLRY